MILEPNVYLWVVNSIIYTALVCAERKTTK